MKLGLIFAAPLLLSLGCGFWNDSKSADVIKIVGCVLTEAAKVAPNRMPTWAEAAQIALTCGVADADTVIDLVSYHRTASRLEGGK